MIHEFYAVTRHSVYHVKDNDGDGFPFAEKIDGKHSIGEKIEGGTLIAICKQLIIYEPHKDGEGSSKRAIEHNPQGSQKGGTSGIVALFKDQEMALECSARDDLKPCDPRWLEQTEQVLGEIGENHPAFTICHWPPMALIAV